MCCETSWMFILLYLQYILLFSCLPGISHFVFICQICWQCSWSMLQSLHVMAYQLLNDIHWVVWKYEVMQVAIVRRVTWIHITSSTYRLAFLNWRSTSVHLVLRRNLIILGYIPGISKFGYITFTFGNKCCSISLVSFQKEFIFVRSVGSNLDSIDILVFFLIADLEIGFTK